MTRDLSKNGQEVKTRQLLEYEYDKDICLLNNTPFTTYSAHNEFGTKNKKNLID